MRIRSISYVYDVFIQTDVVFVGIRQTCELCELVLYTGSQQLTVVTFHVEVIFNCYRETRPLHQFVQKPDINERFLHQFIAEWQFELNLLAIGQEFLFLEETFVLVFWFVVFLYFNAFLYNQLLKHLLTVYAEYTNESAFPHQFYELYDFVNIRH